MEMSGLEFKTAMQVVQCVEIEEFSELFPHHSPEWRSKMYDEMRQNFPYFICKLDTRNTQIFTDFLIDQVERQF